MDTQKQIEGLSTTRPPHFNGTNYNYWKTRMRIFLSSNDFDVWQIILSGHQDPILNREAWNEHEKKAHTINAKAMNAIYCALNETEFNRVSLCSTAKEIWDLLEVTHEGTSQVKESKISLLTHKYETFKMEEDESINNMYNRFNDIIVGLKGLGKTIGKAELNRKLLLSLPKEWRPKVTAIEEAKDLNSMSMEELLGSLITHENILQMDKEEVETKKKKRNDLALKLVMQEDEEDSDEEMALLTRRFKSFMKRRVGATTKRYGDNKGNKVFKGKEKKESPSEKIQCYKCRGFGHMMSECPNKDFEEQEPRGKKILQASIESDDEDNEDDFSEFCFMGMEKEEDDEDLESAFQEIYEQSISLAKKNKELKEQMMAMELEKMKLEEKLATKDLELNQANDKEKELLQLIEDKNMEFNKMLGGSRKLTNMLLHNKSSSCKIGLGGDNHKGNFNQPLKFVKCSIPIGKDYTNVASTSKGKQPSETIKRMEHNTKRKKSQAPKTARGRRLSPHTCHKKKQANPHRWISLARRVPRAHDKDVHITCNYCGHNGHMQWRCVWKKQVNHGKAIWVPKKTPPMEGIDFFIP